MRVNSILNYRSAYGKHRGLIFNLISVFIFWGIKAGLGEQGIDNMKEVPWTALLFLIVFFLEPWAVYYSMGIMNQRRVEAGLDLFFLHRWMRGLFICLLFWGGRVAIFGTGFIMSLQTLFGANRSEPVSDIVILAFAAVIFIREGFVVAFMASSKPKPDFKPSIDFIADIILMVILAFGHLMLDAVFREFAISNARSVSEALGLLFPLTLFFFMIYLPVRYSPTVEEFTFADTNRKKLESWLSFVVSLLGVILYPAF